MSLYKGRGLLTRLRLWFGLVNFTASDITAIEPLPGTRVLITQPRKAGSREPDYASTYKLEHNLAPARMMGVDYKGSPNAVTERGYLNPV